ncbi:hypothetical protein SRIMM317S_02962 [Streptomyces rimosus subsp. rimosus]
MPAAPARTAGFRAVAHRCPEVTCSHRSDACRKKHVPWFAFADLKTACAVCQCVPQVRTRRRATFHVGAGARELTRRSTINELLTSSAPRDHTYPTRHTSIQFSNRMVGFVCRLRRVHSRTTDRTDTVPTQHRAIQSRQTLIRSAAQAFIEKGVPASGMVDISRRARLSKGLYSHFASKDDLTLAVQDEGRPGRRARPGGRTGPRTASGTHRRTGLRDRAAGPGGRGCRRTGRAPAASGDRAGDRPAGTPTAVVRTVPGEGHRRPGGREAASPATIPGARRNCWPRWSWACCTSTRRTGRGGTRTWSRTSGRSCCPMRPHPRRRRAVR